MNKRFFVQNISDTQDPEIYQTERYGKEVRYSLPIANGQYTLRLHFAEIYVTHVGDEINAIAQGYNGGWPDTVGNGICNYTPTIASGWSLAWRGSWSRWGSLPRHLQQ